MSGKIRSARMVDKSSRKRLGKGRKVGQIVTPKPGHDKLEDHATELSPTMESKFDEDEDTAWKEYWSSEELLNRYKPIRELGRGSYGVVYEAVSLWEDEKLGIKVGTKVALKKIRRLWKTDTDAKRLLREIRILRQLHGHKCIVRLFDILPPKDPKGFGAITLVFEFVDADLAKIFKTYQFFSSLHVEYMLYHLLLGLKYMHGCSIAHRDLKPANVLINADCTIKICDFGLARHYMDDLDEVYDDPLKKNPEDENVSKSKKRRKVFIRRVTSHVVTRWYRPVEVIILNQKEKYLAAVDIWSVGCIFAELMQMNKANCSNVASRGPLFPGDSCFPLSPKKPRNGHGVTQSTYDQILVIFEILGKPLDSEICELTCDDQARKYLIESKPHDSYHSRKSQNRHQKRHAKHVNAKHKKQQPHGQSDCNDEKEDLNANGLRGGVDFEEMFPGSNANSIDLLRKMLAFKPQDRINVDDAIKHPVFDRVRDVEAEKVACIKKVDFDFEGVRLEKSELRALILEEVAYYNPGQRERFVKADALFKVDY